MWAENATWPLVLSLIAVAFFEISSGPIVWMYLGEITTDKGASFCTIANGLVNMCVAIFPRSINKAWGPWKGPALMFYFCFVCSLLGTIFLVFYMKETKGLTNAQMKDLYTPGANNVALNDDDYVELTYKQTTTETEDGDQNQNKIE